MAEKPISFLKRVVQSPPKRCVEWPFGVDRLGYGRVLWNGRQMPAHRASWELYHNRKMSPGMDACHAPRICHSRSCVNPLHIREDTRTSNMKDTIADGTVLRGAKNAQAKLSEVEAVAILSDHRPRREIAASFGVSVETVRSIKTGRRWAHLTDTFKDKDL